MFYRDTVWSHSGSTSSEVWHLISWRTTLNKWYRGSWSRYILLVHTGRYHHRVSKSVHLYLNQPYYHSSDDIKTPSASIESPSLLDDIKYSVLSHHCYSCSLTVHHATVNVLIRSLTEWALSWLCSSYAMNVATREYGQVSQGSKIHQLGISCYLPIYFIVEQLLERYWGWWVTCRWHVSAIEHFIAINDNALSLP